MAHIGEGGVDDHNLLFHTILTSLTTSGSDMDVTLIENVSVVSPVNTSIDEVENWDGSEQLFDGYSSALLHFASACCIIFILVGIPGNLITIIALFRCKKVSDKIYFPVLLNFGYYFIRNYAIT